MMNNNNNNNNNEIPQNENRQKMIQNYMAEINFMLERGIGYDTENNPAQKLYDIACQDIQDESTDRSIETLKFLTERGHKASTKELYSIACEYLEDELLNQSITPRSEKAEEIFLYLIICKQSDKDPESVLTQLENDIVKRLQQIAKNYRVHKEFKKAAGIYEELLDYQYNEDKINIKFDKLELESRKENQKKFGENKHIIFNETKDNYIDSSDSDHEKHPVKTKKRKETNNDEIDSFESSNDSQFEIKDSIINDSDTRSPSR